MFDCVQCPPGKKPVIYLFGNEKENIEKFKAVKVSQSNTKDHKKAQNPLEDQLKNAREDLKEKHKEALRVVKNRKEELIKLVQEKFDVYLSILQVRKIELVDEITKYFGDSTLEKYLLKEYQPQSLGFGALKKNIDQKLTELKNYSKMGIVNQMLEQEIIILILKVNNLDFRVTLNNLKLSLQSVKVEFHQENEESLSKSIQHLCSLISLDNIKEDLWNSDLSVIEKKEEVEEEEKKESFFSDSKEHSSEQNSVNKKSEATNFQKRFKQKEEQKLIKLTEEFFPTQEEQFQKESEMQKAKDFENSNKKSPFVVLLKEFELTASLINDQDLFGAKKMDSLTSIDLKTIQQLKKVTLNFSLASVQDFRTRGDLIYIISNLIQINHFSLDLSRSQITDEEIKYILESLESTPQIKTFELNLQGTKISSKTLLNVLGILLPKMTQLEELNLDFSDLQISDNDISSLFLIIPKNNLNRLTIILRNTDVTNQSLEILKKTPLQNLNYLNLCLKNTNISDQGIFCFLDFLQKSTELYQIDLSLKGTKVTEASRKSIQAKCLEKGIPNNFPFDD